MNPKDDNAERPARNIVRLFAGAVFVAMMAATSAQAITTYSGASVSSNGTVNGWGVTDAYVSGMLHTAYVSTTLTSPRGRTSGSGWQHATTSVRADVNLGWDGTDLGTYTETSDHKYYCYAVMYMIYLARTLKSTTLPYVLFSLVNSGSIPDDNAAKAAFNTRMGSTSLGTRYYPTAAVWGTGVQIVGTVYPSNFSEAITIHREALEDKEYAGSTLARQNAPPIYDDTSFPELRDDYAQPIYDLDAPGIGGVAVGTTYRSRTNFRQWAVLNSRGLVVSPISLYWYSRISVKGTSTGDQLASDVPGDNVAAAGTTKTTWDLN